MKPIVLDWLVCPVCRTDLRVEDVFEEASFDHGTEIEAGTVSCTAGHLYPISGGVPRLLPTTRIGSSDDARSIQESFSREWSHFDYEHDRTWGFTLEERRSNFVTHIDRDPEWVEGKVVLDAGCGNGVLSRAMATYGCDVVATDISASVENAYRQFVGGFGARLHFVQSDLMCPIFRTSAFDIIYSGGVLHHTPNTRSTFGGLVPALAPGGTMFVWLYWNVPGLRPKLAEAVRRLVAPLPARAKHGVVWALVPQNLVRQELRIRRGRQRPDDRLNTREVLVRMLDSYTPRYRWLHTPGEVEEWFREFGFSDIETTEELEDGFGVAARKVPVPEHLLGESALAT
jgi:SAM-dependent methyltransferase/uncharacterized protein YbaR (Trm112 family)